MSRTATNVSCPHRSANLQQLLTLIAFGLLMTYILSGNGDTGALLTARPPKRTQKPLLIPTARPDDGDCPPSGRLVSINKAGRLGNLMSEYATLLGVSKGLRRPAWLLPEMAEILNSYFEPLSTPVLSHDCRLNWTQIIWQRLMKEQPTGDENHLITGFPQPLSLYHPLREQLLREFTFRPELRVLAAARLTKLARKAKISEPTFIGVHVRRTDYDTWLERSGGGHLVGVGYLSRAMALMRQRHARALFVVASDDLEWCRRRLRGPDILVAGGQDVKQPGADLALLAACNHTVVTHGTFGFWAAYLAGGEVVGPTGIGQRTPAVEESVKSVGLNWTWLEAFPLINRSSGM